MRKKIFMFNCVVLCLLLGTYSLAAQEWIFFYNGNLTTQLSLGESDYTRDPDYSFVDSSDSGNFINEVSSPPSGGSLGVGYFFNRHLGVAVSMSFFAKIQVDLTSNYTFTWQFPERSQHTSSSTWTSQGKISILPINLNLIYAYYLGRNTIINVTAGASLFLTRFDLATNIGYGVGGQYVFYKYVDANFEKVTVSLVDWYELELTQVKKKNIFGANVGLNIEQRFHDKLSVFAGFCYYFAPKQTSTCELIPADLYQGNFNALSRTIKGDQSNLPDISHVTPGIKISHFSIVLGIKVRLWKRGSGA
ncbi:MAG: hypothetical protein JSV88_24520 [Candidatus Aminicenantes bacterium]|nr:MAG: hypothetical protein JSV88_24520 [Candidatus Aminicenantes bacterium]